MRILATILSLLLLSGGASAAEERDEGAVRAQTNASFDRGMEAFRAGRYTIAREAFEEAYRLSAHHGFLYDIALALRMEGDCAGALDRYQRFLRAEPTTPKRALVETRITEMKACVEARQSPATAAVPTPLPRVDAPILPERPDPSVRRRRLAASLTLATAGVALVVAGAVTLHFAQRRFDELDASCGPRCEPDQWQGWARATNASYALLAIGGAAVVTGSLVGVFWRPRPRRAAQVVPLADAARF